MKPQVLGVVLSLGVLMYAGNALGHHAFSAEYDANKPITLEGTIVKMEWLNPHAWLWIEVTNEDGTVDQWGLEFGPPNALFRRGWRRGSVPIGATVTVTAFLAKDGRKIANGDQVTLPDGQTLFAGSSGTGAPRDPTRAPRR